MAVNLDDSATSPNQSRHVVKVGEVEGRNGCDAEVIKLILR